MKKFFTLVLFLIPFFTQAQICAVNAGTDITICVGQPLNLVGIAGNPQSLPPLYQWSQVSGSAVTIVSPNSTTTAVTGATPGNYVFELTNRCSDGSIAKDYIAVTVLPLPPTPLAGPDITQCNNTPAVQLSANAVAAPLTGTWTVVPAGGTFSPNANTPNATYTPPSGSATYTLTWTISNGFCSTTDDMKINIVSPVTPVNAGPDITLSCGGSCVTMNGSDPGLAPPQGGFWSLVSGTTTPVITNPTSKNTTVCGLQPGTYTLRWTVSGACGSGFDDMVINVTNIFDAPVSGDTWQQLNCSTPRSNTATLSGTPLTAGETGVWTLTSGQTGVTFSPNNTTATVTVSGVSSGPYDYVFKWTKTNAAGCTAAGTHYISAQTAIVGLTTPANQTLVCDATSTTFDISANYPARGGINDAATLVSYPSGGSAATIARTNITYGASAATYTYTESGMTVPGVYVFKVAFDNNCDNAVRTVAITVSRTPGLINAGSDIVLPCNTLTANPIGSSTSSGAGYTINWTQISGPNTATLSGTNTLSLGMSGLTQGVYTMRLNVSGGASCATKTDDMLVTVTTAVPSVATVGANATICAGNYRLGANKPNTPLETGTWTVSPSAGVSFIPNANDPNAFISGMLPSTVYTLTWTVSNPCGSKTATQVLTTTAVQSPPIPNAQPDQCLTGTGTLTTPLPGSNPAGTTPSWTALDAGSSVSPNNTQNTTATITGANGSYRFVYTLTKAGCTSLSDTVVVTKTSGTTSNAGADISICTPTLPASTTMAATPATGGVWAQISGPTSATITTPTSATSSVTGLQAGVYEFEWRIKNGVCADAVDIMQIKVTQSPTVANAGPDQNFCTANWATVVTLAGNNPTVGSGYWQLVSTPPGGYAVTITNPTQYNTTATPGWSQGTYKFLWTTTNGVGCPNSSDTMYVNMNISAWADGDKALCNATNLTLPGNVNTTGTWSQVGGPSTTLTPTTPASNMVNISGLTTGATTPNVYTYRYTLPAVGGCPSTFSDAVITNYPKPSQANAGADVQLCFNQNTVTLTGNTPAVGTGLWVLESGPNTPTAGAPNGNYADTILNNIVPGLYSYRYEVNTNPACIASVDKMQIVKEITANAKPDIRICNATSVNLNATPSIINTATWSQVSGPNTATFNNVNAPNAIASGLVPGTYVFRWTISSPGGLGCATNSDDVQVIIDPAVPAMNAGLDTSFCQGTVNPFTIGSAAQSGVTYTWTPATYLSSSSVAQPTFNGVNNAGTYTYTVKGNIGTCEAFDQVNVIVKPKPQSFFTFNNTSCIMTFSPAVTSGGDTYNWNFGATANPATATGAGPHTVTYRTPGPKTVKLVVTGSNGCVDSTSITFTPNCVLPITLISFNAKWKGENSELVWKVESASAFSNFIVERSFDGVSYTSIGTVNFNTYQSVYSFIDNSIPITKNKFYYRLKMINADGSFKYSNTELLISTKKSDVVIAPNPFAKNVTVVLNSIIANEQANFAILSADGKTVLNKNYSLTKGNNNVEITELERLSAGVYFLRITRENQTQVHKIVKL